MKLSLRLIGLLVLVVGLAFVVLSRRPAPKVATEPAPAGNVATLSLAQRKSVT